MKKHLLAACAVLVMYMGANAQQLPQYTQYMINSYLINPALAGTEDFIDMKVGYRNQWGGAFGGQAPKTYYVSAHSAIGKPHEYYHHKGENQNWHGVGGMVIGDQTGPTSANSFLLSYSYNMGIIKPRGSGIYKKGGVRASFGLFAGLKQFKIDWDKITTAVPEAPQNLGGVQGKLKPEISIGTWIYGEKWYVGLSSFQLLNSSVDYSDFATDERNGNSSIGTLTQHFFVTAGAKVPLSEMVNWIPSILFKGVAGAPLALDINSRFDYDDSYWVGASYRHGESVSLMAGAVINYLVEVAYSYDIVINNASKYNANGSHEITLGFRINPNSHLHNAERFWK